MIERVERLRGYCLERLSALKYLDDTIQCVPAQKLRLTTKINIINHLIEFKGYENFLDETSLEEYIESRTNIICGFYE